MFPKLSSAGLRILGFLAGTCAFAQIEIPYEKFVLNNGLTVIVDENDKAPTVAVIVWLSRGFEEMNEPVRPDLLTSTSI